MIIVYIQRRDRMVVGFTTTCAISDYQHSSCEFESAHDEVYSIQHYVQQVGGFLRYPGSLHK